MEESTCHDMVIHLLHAMCIYLFVFLRFFVSFKSDFNVDAERMIVKTREM